jgi:branched-chain amino acid transport system substrate-binding protein
VTALVLAAPGCGGDQPDQSGRIVRGDTLTIYASLPQRGEKRAQSLDLIRAEQLALEEAHGRAGRFKIRYVPLDDTSESTGAWDPEKTSRNARRAVRDPTTIAYLGESDWQATAVSLPVVNEAGILQVSPDGSYAGLTRADGGAVGEPERFYPSGKRTFGRVVPTDNVQATAIATLMSESACTQAYLLDDSQAYGKAMVSMVGDQAKQKGVTVLDSQGVAPASLAAQAQRIERSNADCLLLAAGGPSDQGARLLRQLHDVRPAMRFFAPATLAVTRFLRGLGSGVESQVQITTPPIAAQRSAHADTSFLSAFENRYGRRPKPQAVFGYEAISAVLFAIDAAGSSGNDRAEVVKRFFGIRKRDSALGTYDIDANGDTTLSVYGANRVRNGRLVLDRVMEVRAG